MADTERARGWLSSVDLLSRRLSVSCFELLGLYLAICKAAFYSTIWLYTFETSVRERERESSVGPIEAVRTWTRLSFFSDYATTCQSRRGIKLVRRNTDARKGGEMTLHIGDMQHAGTTYESIFDNAQLTYRIVPRPQCP